MKTQIFGLLAAAALLAGCAGTNNDSSTGGSSDNDHNILTGGPITGTTIQDLPQPVRQQLKRYDPNAEISDIDKLNRGGQVVYKFSFTQPRLNPPLYLTPDGSVWWESSVDRL